MSGNPRVLLENIVRAFLVRYWDMPSSADNHHAYPWGHCLHSLDVACGEAELASAWTPMNTVEPVSLRHDSRLFRQRARP